ncbi:pteridine reductase [Tahibacter amnicola]|uniref:Pteridine reductase n=1 Tax=Tahibacter amnicola TaxID=2976241 RepID=A0ABY6BDV9_9GAMM|nr:pteridine reductase [Tahibacter amnicola]UXI68228.1 pteridine reductase [Tahibacter amnicola]
MTPSRPVALITGSARRVGATVARRLHAEGFDLVLHCRHSRDALDALAAELEQRRPSSTLVVQGELAQEENLPAMIDAATGRFGRLDGLVNNASAFYPTPVGKINARQWDELFAANARAPLFLSQAAAPALRHSQGCIVNIADIYAERPLAGHTVYCMAKAALLMLTRSLALELAPDIRVNAVAPGAILWPESGKAVKEQQAVLDRVPMRRTGSAEDVAAAVLWLMRDARYTTGEVVRIDGGRSLSI